MSKKVRQVWDRGFRGRTTYRQWVWCRSYVVVRVEFHRCGFGSYITYRDDYRFESSPGRLPILKNTYTYDPQSMFCRNHKFACAANFVGSGDCNHANDCLALLAGARKKFNVTVEYHTTRTYYPGFPIRLRFHEAHWAPTP